MTLTCEWCGQSFEQTNVRGPIPKYCKRSHRQRAYEARQERQDMKLTCNICGNKYEVTRTVVVYDSILISIKPHEECLEIQRREATNPTQS